MTNTTHPHDPALTALQASASLSNRDLATFHYFNPNGIVAEWNHLSDRLLDFGRGYLAYGATGFYRDELYRMSQQKRVHHFSLCAVLNGIRRTIERGEAFLAENDARPPQQEH